MSETVYAFQEGRHARYVTAGGRLYPPDQRPVQPPPVSVDRWDPRLTDALISLHVRPPQDGLAGFIKVRGEEAVSGGYRVFRW